MPLHEERWGKLERSTVCDVGGPGVPSIRRQLSCLVSAQYTPNPPKPPVTLKKR